MGREKRGGQKAKGRGSRYAFTAMTVCVDSLSGEKMKPVRSFLDVLLHNGSKSECIFFVHNSIDFHKITRIPAAEMQSQNMTEPPFFYDIV